MAILTQQEYPIRPTIFAYIFSSRSHKCCVLRLIPYMIHALKQGFQYLGVSSLHVAHNNCKSILLRLGVFLHCSYKTKELAERNNNMKHYIFSLVLISLFYVHAWPFYSFFHQLNTILMCWVHMHINMLFASNLHSFFSLLALLHLECITSHKGFLDVDYSMLNNKSYRIYHEL